MEKKLTILLVEDNSKDSAYLKSIISNKHNVCEKQDISSALDHLKSNNVDIILLDLNIPDSAGLKTLSRFKTLSNNTPIIVLTENEDEPAGLEAVKNGAQDYFIKRVCPERMLQRIIRYAVERHQHLKDLHESEKQFRILSEQAPYAILIHRDNRWLYANKTAEKITEYSLNEILSMNLMNLVYPEDQHRVAQNMKKRISGKNVSPYEFHILTKGGQKKRVFLTGTILNFQGKPSTLISVVDITEQHRLKESIERDDKLKSLGVLAAGIAHDFNNLLNGIFGNIELAQSAMETGKNASKFLDRALSVFDRTKTLTQQLLTFSKGGIPFINETDIAETVLDSAKVATENFNCEVVSDVEQDLRACNHDKVQIRQAIRSIIKNACEAMGGKGLVIVKISNVSKDKIRIDICDSGKGIEKEAMKRIFDPFFSTKELGLGLGLATAHSIIKKHDGNIEVESAVEEGSTFTIFLPSNVPSVNEVDLNKKLPENKKVLIMDDEYFIQDLLVSYLSEVNAETFCASNGDEALEIIKNEGDIAVAILDLTVPGGKGGKDIIKEIIDSYPDIKVFATSGYSSDPVISNPQNFGFTGSIPKPFKRSQLCEQLKAYLCCDDFLT